MTNLTKHMDNHQRLVYLVNLWLEYDSRKQLKDMIAAERDAFKELNWEPFVWWTVDGTERERPHD